MGALDIAMTRPSRLKFLPDLVVKNVVALYGVQAGRKLIPLASIPYLARVLGPAGWGEVAFVTSLAEVIAVVIEFGFTLSATRSIARHRDNASELGRIAVGVLCAQVLLAGVCVGIALTVAPFIPLLRDHPSLLSAGLVYAVAQGFVPLWYFQGMERLRLMASLEVGAKLAALGFLFAFVRSPQDVWRAIAIQATSPTVCVLLGLWLAFRGSSVCRPGRRILNSVFKESWEMFMFRSAESLYGVANAFLLGLFAPAVVVGYFSSAEKITKATAGLVNPIRDSLYPRISHLMHHNRSEAVRLARIGGAIMISAALAFSTSLFLFAPKAITILMGTRFEPAVHVLQILSPMPILIAIAFACGQLWLIPQHKDRLVLRIVWRAAVLNVLLSFVLGPRWGHIGMASAVLLSESVVAGSLLWSVIRLQSPAPSAGALSASV